MSSSESSKTKKVVHVPVVTFEYSGDPREHEPSFPTEGHQDLYRDLVIRMEREASILPGMSTAVGLVIRTLARDYVVRLIADQENDQFRASAKRSERDNRMMQGFRLLMDQAMKADLGHALRTEFVLGLVGELMRILDAEVDDLAARVRLKELMSSAFVTYTEGVQGRITR